MATWPYYLFAVVAGAMLPFQFGINSVLARYVDGAARPSLVSFVVGAFALLVAVLVFFRGVPSVDRVAAAPWWTVDHFGLVGFEENPITPGRLLGIGLVAAGVVLVRVF